MKKLIKILVVLVLLAIVGIAVASFLFIGRIVKSGVEKAGPMVTKTPVKLDGANVSILGGSGELKGFVVGNPDGYKSSEAIKVGTISLSLVPKSVMADKVVIRSIKVEGPEITYEKTGLRGSNLDQILDNIRGEEKKPSTPSQGGKSSGSQKKLQVDEFIITGAKVHAVLPVLGTQTLPLPEIKFTNLGQGPDGITAAELSQRVLSEVLAMTVKVVAEKGGAATGGAIDKVNQLKKVGGDLFKK